MSLFVKENLLNYRREYYQNNKTRLKEFYKENKDRILQKFKNKKYICQCGKELGFYSRLKHYESRIHNKKIMLKIYIRRWYLHLVVTQGKLT